jgi:hypothetical protein
MDTTESHAKRNWEHVHRCPRCGHIIKADEISHSATANQPKATRLFPGIKGAYVLTNSLFPGPSSHP